MRHKILRYIREFDLLVAGDRVLVAVSGGADSVALLRVLRELRSELGIVLAVAHFNHGLREQAVDDEAFVGDLAERCGLEFLVTRADVREHASSHRIGTEAAGRELRYKWFAQQATEHKFDCVATAHTQDDQAETVLLKFLRGAGTRGLAGIYPVLKLCASGECDSEAAGTDGIRVVRPLLNVARSDVEAYLTAIGQSWREDETNLDRRFLRNRVRHDLLPLIERGYNPNVRQLLSDVAEIARGDEDYWSERIEQELATRASSNQLGLGGFSKLPVALQRRVLKRWAESDGAGLNFRHVEDLRRCAVGEAVRTEIPGGQIAIAANGYIRLCAEMPDQRCDYEYVLPVPGEVYVAEVGAVVRSCLVPEEFARASLPGVLLARQLLASQLQVRNWRHGDRYLPAQRGSEEKVKRLFAEQHVPAEARRSWPVATQADEIVWMRGFPVAAAYEWKGSGEAVQVEIVEQSAT